MCVCVCVKKTINRSGGYTKLCSFLFTFLLRGCICVGIGVCVLFLKGVCPCARAVVDLVFFAVSLNGMGSQRLPFCFLFCLCMVVLSSSFEGPGVFDVGSRR